MTQQNQTLDPVSKIQITFIVITIIFITAFYSVGCLEKSDPTVVESTKTLAGVENNAGISKAIKDHLGTTLGQIIAVENYYQNSAQAIVTLTMPKADVAKVYLLMQNGTWVIERVEKGYTY